MNCAELPSSSYHLIASDTVAPGGVPGHTVAVKDVPEHTAAVQMVATPCALDGVTVRLAGHPDAALDVEIDLGMAALWNKAATSAVQAGGNPQSGWSLQLQPAAAFAA